MWISELTQEFLDWIVRSNNYSDCGKCKNILKFFFFGLISSVILIYLLTVDYGEFKTISYFIYMSLKIYVMIDLCLYAVRLWYLCGSYHEPHSVLFLHMLIHLLLISNIIHVYYYEYIYGSEDNHSKYYYNVIKELSEFEAIYPIVKLRVFVYVILLILTIVTSPCLISTILRRRRERIQYFERIRQMRAQHEQRYSDYVMPLLDHPRNNQNFAQFDQEQAHDINAPYMPVEEFEIENHIMLIIIFLNPPIPVLQNRNQSINDRLLDLIQGIQPAFADHETISKLKRISYEDEKPYLSADECSICLFNFSEFQDEKLIYLPCSRKHIFHSNCIIDWLHHECSCPLCKAPVTRETVRYGNY